MIKLKGSAKLVIHKNLKINIVQFSQPSNIASVIAKIKNPIIKFGKLCFHDFRIIKQDTKKPRNTPIKITAAIKLIFKGMSCMIQIYDFIKKYKGW